MNPKLTVIAAIATYAKAALLHLQELKPTLKVVLDRIPPINTVLHLRGNKHN